MRKKTMAGRMFVLTLLLSVLASPVVARADVKMPAIFGDHMVLQQDGKIPIWGWADPGETVSVKLGNGTAKTTADGGGKWSVSLKPLAATATPLTLTVTGKNTLTFTDVLIGDVWVCSGQSNMEFDLAGPYKGKNSFGGDSNAATVVPAANDPQLRLFVVTKKVALDPQTDVVGTWQVCTPDSAAFFSAVGYFFGQELRRSLNRPIGLIGTYWGGMPAQAFTSISGLEKDPPFTKYVQIHQQRVANFATATAKYPAALADYLAKKAAWEKNDAPAFMAANKKWRDAITQADASGQPRPPRPADLKPPPATPIPPEGAPYDPGSLFNGMIAPLIPYGIKGVIWYQGEANSGAPAEYKTLFPRMISDWREKWGQGDFPFLFVQLAAFLPAQKKPTEGGWAYLREAQLDTLSLPNTGMAVTIDIGNAADGHPKDKHDVGLRLALAAKHVAYGQNLVYSGPIYDSMKVEGNKIRLSFKDTGSGLKMSAPPWTPSGVPAPAPTELTGFAIAGADRNWVWAKAEIDGQDVVVSSDQVASPVAVRYGWANNPPCNLYNNEGLPASPFRTDDWDDASPAPAKPPADTTASQQGN